MHNIGQTGQNSLALLLVYVLAPFRNPVLLQWRLQGHIRILGHQHSVAPDPHVMGERVRPIGSLVQSCSPHNPPTPKAR